MNGSSDLTVFDDYIRKTWVECCGHLSNFSFDNCRYERETGGVDGMWGSIFGTATRRKEVVIEKGVIKKILKVGDVMNYEYDYGTPTELRIKVISLFPDISLKKRDTVFEIARNYMPEVLCSECKKEKATIICSMCMSVVCKKCTRKHQCYIDEGNDDYMYLDFVNSPRTGVCAYQ